LAEQDAQVADTPRKAAQDADVIAAMVGDDPASRAVWLGDDGALAGAKPGAILVECSTLTPDWVRELAAQARARGCDLLDAPVTGSKAAAANGQLNLFVGGEAATLEKARPALEAISKQIFHLGPVATGATWKLINNMMTAMSLVAVSEGLALAEKAGFDLQQVAPLILNGPASSPAIQMKMPRLTERRYDDPDFSLRWMHKDMRYALVLAAQMGVRLSAAEAAAEVYERACAKVSDELDFAAVVEAVRG
jgi:3-hydroxyisobutyrate dehydrogenase